jgi:hypothetical protein
MALVATAMLTVWFWRRSGARWCHDLDCNKSMDKEGWPKTGFSLNLPSQPKMNPCRPLTSPSLIGK